MSSSSLSSFSQAASTYHPTLLEQAYAGYLMEAALSLSSGDSSNASAPSRSNFFLSGRTAVPFLQSSLLPRVLLREFWNVVDPRQVGTLTDVLQWQTLLRLVALAQQRHIPAIGAPATPPISTDQIKAILQMTQSYTHLSLAHFQQVIIPPAEVLLQQYAHWVIAPEVKMTNASNSVVSISDAFDDALIPSVDAPLPSLSKSNDNNRETNDEKLQGSVDGEAYLNKRGDAVPEGIRFGQGAPNFSFDADPFADNQQAEAPSVEITRPDAIAPAPSHERRVQKEEGGTAAGADAGAEAGDQFGDFADAISANDPTTVLPENASSDPCSSAFDKIAPVEDTPLFSFGVSQNMESKGIVGSDMVDDLTDSFGAVSAEPTAADKQEPVEAKAATSDDPLSSAFDEIAPVQDMPLAPLGDAALSSTVDAERKNISEENVGEDDEFGTFEDAAHSGSEQADNEKQQNGKAPLASAFDEIAPLHDTPIATFGTTQEPGAAKSEIQGASREEKDNNDEYEDFGMFAGANAEETAGVVKADHEKQQEGSEPLTTAFDEIAPVQDASLNPLGMAAEPCAAKNEQKDTSREEKDNYDDYEDFGTFASVTAPKTADTKQANYEKQQEGSEPLTTAFDEIAPLQEAPLNPLEMAAEPCAAKSEQKATSREEKGNDDDYEDFGTFADAIAAEPAGADRAEFEKDQKGDTQFPSPFDEITPIQDVPLVSLGMTGESDAVKSEQNEMPETEKDEEDNDDFGTFADATGGEPVGEQAERGQERGTQFSSTLNEIPSVPDASFGQPDPSRQSCGPDLEGKQVADREGVFGNLANATAQEPKVATTNDHEGPEKPQDGQPFPPVFDEIAPVQDQPLAPLGVMSSPMCTESEDKESAGSGSSDRLGDSSDTKLSEHTGFPSSEQAERLSTSSKLPFSSSCDEIAPVQNVQPDPLGTSPACQAQAARLAIEADEDDDQFGDFACRPDTALQPEQVESPEAHQLSEFSLVESAPTRDELADPMKTLPPPQLVDPFAAADSISSSSENAPSREGGDVGQPASSSPLQAETQNKEDDDDDFGDFEAIEMPSDHLTATLDEKHNSLVISSQESQKRISPNVEEEDEFGDFAGFTTTSWDQNLVEEEKRLQAKNLDGASTAAVSPHNADVFRAFNNVPDVGLADSNKAEGSSEKTFGALEDEAKPNEAVVEMVASDRATLSESAFEADFDHFVQPKSAPEVGTPDTVKESSTWGTLQVGNSATDSSQHEGVASLEEIEKCVRDLASKASPEVSASEGTGGSIDLYDSFVRNIVKAPQKNSGWRSRFKRTPTRKMTGPPSSEQLSRALRAYQILNVLTSTNSNLPSSWSKTFTIVRDELATASLLLDDVSELSAQVQHEILANLSVFVAGLVEYVRVVRSIVATVGDLLGLTPTVDFDRITFEASWGSLMLLRKALEVEELWVGIDRRATELGLQQCDLESIVAIRCHCLENDTDAQLCQLTLQRLNGTDKSSTKSLVVWEEKTFMACSANLLANRISAF